MIVIAGNASFTDLTRMETNGKRGVLGLWSFLNTRKAKRLDLWCANPRPLRSVPIILVYSSFNLLFWIGFIDLINSILCPESLYQFVCLVFALTLWVTYYVAVLASTSVQEHTGNDKSCVWHATDFSDGELKEELFCIRFASVESEF